ncbi:MAG: Glu-tRNA(Gln) amidotransferase subunit GatD [Ferroplasma sp.]
MLTGQKINFTYHGKNYAGTFITSNEKTVTVKLENGYNITVNNNSISILGSSDAIETVESDTYRSKGVNGRDGIYIMTTGGTIGSSVDYKTGAVKPVKDISYLYNFVNNIKDVKLYHENIDNILSENVNPERWINFARKAKNRMKDGNSIIIFHGTDTMQYSAAALSFMFEEQTNPVIFTGSQRSSDRPSSDAFLNIEGAIHFAGMDKSVVGIAMHGSISDDYISLHNGVRARKLHTSRRNAFTSVDTGELATYKNGKIKKHAIMKKASDRIILKDKLNSNVGIIYFYPGMPQEDFYNMAYSKDAVIILGTGLGHTSASIIDVIKKLSRETHFFMTSQCIYGNVNLNVYSTGRELLEAGVIPLGDMLAETAMVKAMFVLANYPDELEKKMVENMRGEINAKIR